MNNNKMIAGEGLGIKLDSNAQLETPYPKKLSTVSLLYNADTTGTLSAPPWLLLFPYLLSISY